MPPLPFLGKRAEWEHQRTHPDKYFPKQTRFPEHQWSGDTQSSRWVEPPAKKNTWLRNAKCFILESVQTTDTLVLHLKSESKDLFNFYGGVKWIWDGKQLLHEIQKLSLMGKSNVAAGRALRCLLRIVAWALPTGLMAWFPSRVINSVIFRGRSPRYGWVWRGRLKSCGYGFQTTFFNFYGGWTWIWDKQKTFPLNTKLSLMGKFNAAAGRAVRCLLGIVAWALPTELIAWFSSQVMTWRRFFVGEAHATAGCEGRLKP